MNDSATKTILEKIKNSGLLAGIEEKEAASLLAKRKEAAQQIAVLEAQRSAEIPRLRKIQQKCEAAYEQICKEAVRLKDEMNKAYMAAWSADYQCQQEINRQKDILLGNYDPKIDRAIEWFGEKLKWLREDGRIRHHFAGKKNNLIDWTVTKSQITNRFAVLDALEYCKRSRDILNQMKLLPEINEKAIESLKAGLPDVMDWNAFVEVSETKDINPQMSSRTKFLWDCLELEMDIERTKDKVDKILKVGKYYPWPKAA